MIKRNHIVLLSYWRSAWISALASVFAVCLAGYAFADKQHSARVEKTVQLEDITRFEGIKICDPGPECPKPWVLTVRAPYTFVENGQPEDVVDAPQDDIVEPDVALIDALLRDALDGDTARQGVNEQRGHGRPSP